MLKIDYSQQSIGIIYLVTFPNGKHYIGQTFHTLEVRKNEHRRSQNRYNYPFYKALKKYGIENTSWEIIDTAETKKELDEKEIYYIDFYRSCIYFSDCKGYNVTLGGGGGRVMATLNEKQLEELGKDFNSGMSKKEIKEKYKIEHDYTLNAICAGRVWTEFTKIPKRNFKIWKRGTSLTPKQVDNILEDYKNKKSIQEIAKENKVKDKVILNIIKGKTWSEYTGIKNDDFYINYKHYGYNLNGIDLKAIGEMKKNDKNYEDIKNIFSDIPDTWLKEIWRGGKFSKITKINKEDNKEKEKKKEEIKKNEKIKLVVQELKVHLILKKVQEGQSVVSASKEVGISESCYYQRRRKYMKK